MVSFDLWWNEVDSEAGQLYMTHHQNLDMGHRIADLNTCGPTLESARDQVYEDIRKLRCLGIAIDCKKIVTRANLNVKSLFDKAQVFIKLATERGQAVCVVGLKTNAVS